MKPSDEVKNYTITPRTCRCENLYNGMSPLKPGDSFEKMSQKMLKFDINTKRNHTENPTVEGDDDSVDSTNRRSSSPTFSPPLTSATSSLLGPEVDEEGDQMQLVQMSSFLTPMLINTPTRRKVAVESYIEGIICEVCQSQAVAC